MKKSKQICTERSQKQAIFYASLQHFRVQKKFKKFRLRLWLFADIILE